jgi:hypothetical protein
MISLDHADVFGTRLIIVIRLPFALCSTLSMNVRINITPPAADAIKVVGIGRVGQLRRG